MSEFKTIASSTGGQFGYQIWSPDGRIETSDIDFLIELLEILKRRSVSIQPRDMIEGDLYASPSPMGGGV